MHLLCHFVVALFLLFGFPTIYDGLDSSITFCFLFVFQLLLFSLYGLLNLVEFFPPSIGRLPCSGSESFLAFVPVLAYFSQHVPVVAISSSCEPFLRKPFCGRVDISDDVAGSALVGAGVICICTDMTASSRKQQFRTMTQDFDDSIFYVRSRSGGWIFRDTFDVEKFWSA